MTNFKFKAGMKGLIIIAHPDDETIWLGGVLIMNPNIDWTVLCLARSEDPDRGPKFARVAAKLNFKYFHENLDDLGEISYIRHCEDTKKIIKKHIGAAEFDFVITHGQNGEYGHRDHKSIHEAVKDLAQRGILKARHILFLHMWQPKRRTPLLVPRVNPDLVISVPAKILEAKKDIMEKIYGYSRDGIDTSYCTKVEAFKIKSYT
jgi:LmbE family N-acetylglucosaminyl deacetylase